MAQPLQSGRRLLPALVVIAALSGCGGNVARSPARPLFDGRTLDGWQGDSRVWAVRDGAIVGSSRPAGLARNTFLIADGSYADFTLHADFKHAEGGSGVQFRSRRLTGDGFRVAGFQIDIGDGETGSIYEEAGRGTLAAVDPARLRRILRPGDWNTLTIRAIGNRFEVWVNGRVAARYTEPSSERCPRSGLIALQMQAGLPMDIAFRNLRIEIPGSADFTAPSSTAAR